MEDQSARLTSEGARAEAGSCAVASWAARTTTRVRRRERERRPVFSIVVTCTQETRQHSFDAERIFMLFDKSVIVILTRDFFFRLFQ